MAINRRLDCESSGTKRGIMIEHSNISIKLCESLETFCLNVVYPFKNTMSYATS